MLETGSCADGATDSFFAPPYEIESGSAKMKMDTQRNLFELIEVEMGGAITVEGKNVPVSNEPEVIVLWSDVIQRFGSSRTESILAGVALDGVHINKPGSDVRYGNLEQLIQLANDDDLPQSILFDRGFLRDSAAGGLWVFEVRTEFDASWSRNKPCVMLAYGRSDSHDIARAVLCASRDDINVIRVLARHSINADDSMRIMGCIAAQAQRVKVPTHVQVDARGNIVTPDVPPVRSAWYHGYGAGRAQIAAMFVEGYRDTIADIVATAVIESQYVVIKEMAPPSPKKSGWFRRRG